MYWTKQTLVVALAAALAACDVGPTYPTLVVTIGDDFETTPFHPDTIRVVAGSSIEWKNQSPAYHLLVADSSETFKAGAMPETPLATLGGENRDYPSSAASITWGTAGTFHYHCEIHPSMKGTVIVQ